MIDTIEIETTAKYVDKAGVWVADIKGYPVSGRGDTPEDAAMNARDELQKFFLERLGSRSQFVNVRMSTLSLKVLLEVEIENTRPTTLSEFMPATDEPKAGGDGK
ncbi:hypothetical protein DSECCO2_213030 [anaerobic digester metagenome]